MDVVRVIFLFKILFLLIFNGNLWLFVFVPGWLEASGMDRGFICILTPSAHPVRPENPVNPVKSSSLNNA
jgi:hypothetical protein